MQVVNYYPHIQQAELVNINNPDNLDLFVTRFTIEIIK